MTLFPAPVRELFKCPRCGHPMNVARRVDAVEEEFKFVCPECGYTVVYVVLHERRTEPIQRIWAEASRAYRRYRSV